MHDQPFKKTIFRLEGSLPNIDVFYWDLVIAQFQINLVKEHGNIEFTKEIINSRDWVLIPNFDFVKGSIINTRSPSPILMFHQH